MAFPRKLLNDGEELVLDLNPHWWFMAWETVALVGALVLGLVSLVSDGWLGNDALSAVLGVAIVAALAWWCYSFAQWWSTNFVVTSDRLVYRHGVLTKHGIEIPLDRVNNVMFRQGVFERVLGAGDLTIESAGESGQQHFTDVRKPNAVQQEIYRQMEANENRKYDRMGAAGRAAGGGAPSVADELGKLDDLRTRGVISEEEFAAQKARLLER